MRVLVLGAGYAGVTLARELGDRLPDDVELRVVDETGTHVVQHELHRLVRRPGLADEIELPLAEILEDAEITRARVDGVDPDARTVALGDGSVIDYDVCAISLGADPAFYDLPGLAEHATPLKRIEHARAIREGVKPVIAADGRIVIGGAGLSGIQVAGEVAEMIDAAESDARIYLLEQAETIAPGFDADFRTAIGRELERRDVAIWTDATVEGANADAVILEDGESMAYDELIWTGGIRGDAAMDRERPVVRSDLRLDERSFGIGDAVRVVDDHGERVPASARTAIGQARVAAANVERTVDHLRSDDAGSFTPTMDRYTMGQPRWLVSVGNGAVAQVGQTVLTGRPALALKTSVGAGYLGRIGPIERAVDLVWSELGLASDEDDEPEEPADGTLEERQDEADEPEFEALPDGVVEELREE